MGGGIWSMHYIGMLAVSVPVPVLYDWPTVLLSVIAAILASAVALYLVCRERMSLWRAVAGSMVMGGGMGRMHYMGVAGMRLAGMCHYDASLVALSVGLAIIISFAALRLSFLTREERKGAAPRKIASATVMGAAIPVMHYTGMAAAKFMPASAVPDLSHALSISTLGTASITMVTIMILAFAVLSYIVDRRYSAKPLDLKAKKLRYRLLFER